MGEKSFKEKHPVLNFIIGLLTLCFIVFLIIIMFRTILKYIGELINLISDATSNMDAVIIVALITGTVSLIGAIISSIVSKVVDQNQKRREYLTLKREKPYTEFVEMIYKIQKNGKNEFIYTKQEMVEDLTKFSSQITLWGSKKMISKWDLFRAKCTDPTQAINNLFLIEEIMNEMRKDLGLKKTSRSGLLALFVNDIDKYK